MGDMQLTADGGQQIPFCAAAGVGVEGRYSSKSSLDSPFSLLSDPRSFALIDRLKNRDVKTTGLI